MAANTSPPLRLHAHDGPSWMDPLCEELNGGPWAEILGRFGWTYHHTDGAEDYWTRPGKDKEDGSSATINAKGTDQFTVFSSTPSEFECYDGVGLTPTYDRLDVIAAYDHGGDPVAAARALTGRTEPTGDDWDDLIGPSLRAGSGSGADNRSGPDAGGRVLLIDYEDEAATFKSRMLTLGVDVAVINDPQRVTYIRPEDPLRGRDDKHTNAGRDFDAICADTYDLAIIDGVTDAMVMEGFDPKSNAEVSEWNRLVPKAVAARTGAATVMIDHYGKGVADRRYAIGAQHKRNMITGASYGLEVTEAIGRGKPGGGRLIVGKDRPGYVRGWSVKADKDLIAAVYTVTPDPLTGRVVVTVEPPFGLLDRAAAPVIDMRLAGALHQALIVAGVPMSGNGWKETVGGRDGKKVAAMEWLTGKGHVLKTKVGQTNWHTPNPDLPLTWGGCHQPAPNRLPTDSRSHPYNRLHRLPN